MGLLRRLRDPIFGGAQRARNKPFLEAAMAASALVAVAGGTVSFAKRHALDEVLDSVEALKAFDVHTAVHLFDAFTQAIQDEPQRGRSKAIAAVKALNGQGEQAALVARIAGAIARAEGGVTSEARDRVKEICGALGVPPPGLGNTRRPGQAKKGAGPSVIVLGNEKGGTGKSTTAMHLIAALLGQGHAVGSIDLDGHQGTLSRYLANRAAFAKKSGETVSMPVHRRLSGSQEYDHDKARRDEENRLQQAFEDLAECRFVVVDTPGSTSHLSRLGHGQADVLITPLNDSFLDIDVLAHIDRDRRLVLEPSPYSQMVLEENERRQAGDGKPVDWIVMRNRLAHIDARNTREMADLLERLSKRLNFRLQPGFSERMVYRELFYRGLTLMDLPEDLGDARANMRYHRARREVCDLVEALGVADISAEAGAPLAVPVV